MRHLLSALILNMILASSAWSLCTLTTGGLTLEKPRLGDSGSIVAACLNRNLDVISSSVAVVGIGTTNRFGLVFVSTIGGNPNSNGVNFSSSIFVNNQKNFTVTGGSVSINGPIDPAVTLRVLGNIAADGRIDVNRGAGNGEINGGISSGDDLFIQSTFLNSLGDLFLQTRPGFAAGPKGRTIIGTNNPLSAMFYVDDKTVGHSRVALFQSEQGAAINEIRSLNAGFLSGLYFGIPSDNDAGRIEYIHSSNSFRWSTDNASKMTLSSGGILDIILLTQVGSSTITINTTGTSGATLRLLDVPTLCASGEAPRGVDEFGNPVGCDTVGHAIEDEGVGVTQRSILDFVGSGVTVTDTGGKTQVTIGVGIGDVIRSTGVAFLETATSSVDWVSVPGSTASILFDMADHLKIDLSCNLECDDNTACPVSFAFLVNGEFFDGVTSSTSSGIQFVETNGSNPGSPESLVINYRTTANLNITTNTITMLWSSNDGVAVRMGRGIKACSLTYSASPDTLATGSRGIINDVTDFGAVSIGDLQTSLTCGTPPCRAQVAAGNFCVWVATPPFTVGSWLNQCSALGPYD